MRKKIVSADDDLINDKTFCQSKHSRQGVGVVSLFTEYPPFDYTGFKADLPKLGWKSDNLKSLVDNISVFYGTYFFPPSLVSLAVVKDGSVKDVINSNDSKGVARTADDWAIDDVASVTHLLLDQEPGTIFSFGDATGRWVSDYRKIVPEFSEALLNQETDVIEQSIAFEEKTTNYDILRKELPDDINEEAIVASAVLAPLRFGDSLNGVIMIATNAFHLYTGMSQGILGIGEIPHLQMLVQRVSLILDTFLNANESITGE